jgi:hypothetical protein
MRTVTREDLDRLLGERQPPCVSVYLPTEKAFPQRQQQTIRYGNLVDRAEESLRRDYPSAAGPLLDRLRGLAADSAFWARGAGGVAVLASPGTFDTFDLRNPPRERVAVGDSFVVTPLLRVAESADRYHVLCLQREGVRLYEGNRDRLDAIEPPGVPAHLIAAGGDEVRVEHGASVPGANGIGQMRPTSRGENAPSGPPRRRGPPGAAASASCWSRPTGCCPAGSTRPRGKCN